MMDPYSWTWNEETLVFIPLLAIGYALGVHHWWNAYRRDPATHASGPSLRFLAAFAVLAGLGVAVLVAAG